MTRPSADSFRQDGELGRGKQAWCFPESSSGKELSSLLERSNHPTVELRRSQVGPAAYLIPSSLQFPCRQTVKEKSFIFAFLQQIILAGCPSETYHTYRSFPYCCARQTKISSCGNVDFVMHAVSCGWHIFCRAEGKLQDDGIR